MLTKANYVREEESLLAEIFTDPEFEARTGISRVCSLESFPLDVVDVFNMPKPELAGLAQQLLDIAQGDERFKPIFEGITSRDCFYSVLEAIRNSRCGRVDIEQLIMML